MRFFISTCDQHRTSNNNINEIDVLNPQIHTKFGYANKKLLPENQTILKCYLNISKCLNDLKWIPISGKYKIL